MQVTADMIAAARRMVAGKLELWNASTELEALVDMDINSHSELIDSLASVTDKAEDLEEAALRELVNDLCAEQEENERARGKFKA